MVLLILNYDILPQQMVKEHLRVDKAIPLEHKSMRLFQTANGCF
jgi:hypothetical protein